MISLTIYIQCYNRPVLAKHAINSVLRQTNQSFRLVISDNSSSDELCNMIRFDFPSLEYRRRMPSLPVLDHLNKSISETETELVCLFHDDDLMEPDYVDEMLKTVTCYPHAVAYASNAMTMNGEPTKVDCFFESERPMVVINNSRELAGRYFSRHPNGFAPFPAYIYRTSVIKKMLFDSRTGGKYSDVAWLLELASHGPIIWNSRHLIRYRMHEANDSNMESLRDRLRLLGFLKLNKSLIGQAIINDCRFGIYKKLHKKALSNHDNHFRHKAIIEKYLRNYRLRRLFRLDTYRYIFYKLSKFFV